MWLHSLALAISLVMRTIQLEPLHALDRSRSSVSQDETQAATDPWIGKTIGAYQIIKRLGAGGMGLVYQGEHKALQRFVAIKMLLPDLAANQEFAGRFIREARLAAAVQDPHLVSVYDAGKAGGTLFMVQELVTGGDAAEALARDGAFTEIRALTIILQAAKGLAALEQAGLVHRDIKPSNIFLTASGVAKLGDFGLARLQDDRQLTATGVGLGTPAYMSPEQALGVADIDGRTDIYALGASLFALLTTHHPYSGATPFAVIAKVLNDPLPDLRAQLPGLGANTVTVFTTAMAKDRDQRYPTVAAFVTALEGAVAACSARATDHNMVTQSEIAPLAISRSAAEVTAVGWDTPQAPSRNANATVVMRRSSLVAGIIALVAVMVLAVIGLWLLMRPADAVAPVATAVASSATPAAPAAMADKANPSVSVNSEEAHGPLSPSESAAAEPISIFDPNQVGTPGIADVLSEQRRVHAIGHSFVSGSGSLYHPPLILLDGRFAALGWERKLTATGLPGVGPSAIRAAVSGGAVAAEYFNDVVVLWPARNGVVRDPEQTRIEVQALIDYCSTQGCKRWLICECPLGTRESAPGNAGYDAVRAYNAWLHQTYPAERIVATENLARTYPNGTDHPTTEGYFDWAAMVGDRLVEMGWMTPTLPDALPSVCLRTVENDQVITLEPYPGRPARLPAETDQDHTALIWYKGTGSGYFFGRNDVLNNEKRWGLRYSNGGLWLYLGPGYVKADHYPVRDGRWHCIGWRVKDGSGQLLFDGVVDSQQLTATPLVNPPPWTIGGGTSSSWSPAGQYSLAMIWNHSLSDDEIRLVYNEGRALAPARLPQQQALVACLPLDGHRERANRGWPDLMGNACGSSSNLGSKSLVMDAPGVGAP